MKLKLTLSKLLLFAGKLNFMFSVVQVLYYYNLFTLSDPYLNPNTDPDPLGGGVNPDPKKQDPHPDLFVRGMVVALRQMRSTVQRKKTS